jgi:hypothetical protein
MWKSCQSLADILHKGLAAIERKAQPPAPTRPRKLKSPD